MKFNSLPLLHSMLDDILRTIRLIRESRNLSQDQTADLMSISQSKYARFESGKSKTDLETLTAFAKAMKMPLLDVLTYPERFISVNDVVGFSGNVEATLQVKLGQDKKEKILRLVFGDIGAEILNSN